MACCIGLSANAEPYVVRQQRAVIQCAPARVVNGDASVVQVVGKASESAADVKPFWLLVEQLQNTGCTLFINGTAHSADAVL